MKRKFSLILSLILILNLISISTASATSYAPATGTNYYASKTFRIRTTQNTPIIEFMTTGVSVRITVTDLTNNNRIGQITIPVSGSTFSSSGDISCLQVGRESGKDYLITVELTRQTQINPWSIRAWAGCYPVELVSSSIANGDYYITSQLPGNRRVEIGGGNKNNGATTNIWDSANVTHQIFRFEKLSDGTYKIIPKHSGKPLEVRNSSINNGAEIAQWDWDANYNTKRWYVIKIGSGYKLVNKATGKCMDVSGGTSRNGVKVWQWEDNGTTAQRFTIARAN